MTVRDVVDALHQIAPPELAEEWDNVGLLLGDPAAPCGRVVVTLDVDRGVLRRAARAGAQLVVSHHPPIFKPMASITADCEGGALLLDAAREGIALAAAHTNYDIAPGGVNDVLAGLLELRGAEPLAAVEASAQAKIVVFTPAGDLDAVVAALGRAGAGVIGNYRECTFRSPGVGTFRGVEGANPAVGQAGRREEVDELRVEAVLPVAFACQAVAAVRAAHSYEEPAVDVYPLAPARPELGLGRVGALPKPLRADRLVERIKQCLGVDAVRVVGSLRRRVERVAVLGGGGGRHVADALRRRCQLFLTGDVSHHQALDAAAAGLVVVDAGHAATEAPAIPVLARRLAALCPDVRVTALRAPATGPFALA